MKSMFKNFAALVVMMMVCFTTAASAAQLTYVELTPDGVLSTENNLTVNRDGSVSLVTNGPEAVRNIEGLTLAIKLATNGQVAYQFGHNGTKGERIATGYEISLPANPEIGIMGQSYSASYFYAPGTNAVGQPYWGPNYRVASLIDQISWTPIPGGGCLTTVTAAGATTLVGTLAASTGGTTGCIFPGHPEWTSLIIDFSTGFYCPNSPTFTVACTNGKPTWGWEPGGGDGSVSVDTDTIFKNGFQAQRVVNP